MESNTLALRGVPGDVISLQQMMTLNLDSFRMMADLSKSQTMLIILSYISKRYVI